MEHQFDHSASNPLDDLLKQLHAHDQFSAMPQDDTLPNLMSDFTHQALSHDTDWNAPTFDARHHDNQFESTVWQDPTQFSSLDTLSPAFETYLPDVTPSDLTTSPHSELPQHDWTTLPDLHHDHFQPQSELHAHHFTFHASSNDAGHPHLSIRSNGDVYQNDKYFGEIKGHTIYNAGDWNCGYYTNTGKVYDYHDHLVGEVLPNGHVCMAKSNGDLVDTGYVAEKGAAEGAAYLLLYWCGGQTHI